MSNATSVRRKRIPGLFRHRNYPSLIMYSLGALLMVLMQAAPNFFPTLWYARPVPLVLYVVCVAIFEGAKAGALIGALSGLLWGLYSFRLFGFDALILMGMGLAAGLLVEWVLRANFLSALLMCSVAVFLQALLEWLFTYAIFAKENLWSILLWVFLPNSVYTLLLIPPVYWCVLRMARLIRRGKNN